MNSNKRFDLAIGLAGVGLSVIGLVFALIPTEAQRLQLLWWVVVPVGLFPMGLYLWRLTKDIRTVVTTFGQRWHLVNGRLRIGNKINVALRVRTIQEVLEVIYQSHHADYSKMLREAGRAAGESFFEDLKSELVQHGNEMILMSGRSERLLKDKLQLWSQYDSSTGMGQFTVDQVELNVDGIKGEVLLRNCFLTYDVQADKPVCVFIEGYIEGIVSKLCIPITVHEIECAAVTGTDCCRFQISRA